jgi:hypothetical protein
MRYRDSGAYSEQVERYLDVFGPDRVKIVIFDHFKQNPSAVYRDTCEFLRIGIDFEPEMKIVNPNKKFRSKTLQAAIDNPPGPVKAVGKLLTTTSRRNQFRSYLRRLNTEYVSRTPMSPSLRRQLQAHFAPDVERLSELLDQDLTYWCRA